MNKSLFMLVFISSELTKQSFLWALAKIVREIPLTEYYNFKSLCMNFSKLWIEFYCNFINEETEKIFTEVSK